MDIGAGTLGVDFGCRGDFGGRGGVSERGAEGLWVSSRNDITDDALNHGDPESFKADRATQIIAEGQGHKCSYLNRPAQSIKAILFLEGRKIRSLVGRKDRYGG